MYYVIRRRRWEFATVCSLQVTTPNFQSEDYASPLVDHFIYPGNEKIMARKRAEAPYEEGEEKVLVVSKANSPMNCTALPHHWNGRSNFLSVVEEIGRETCIFFFFLLRVIYSLHSKPAKAWTWGVLPAISRHLYSMWVTDTHTHTHTQWHTVMLPLCSVRSNSFSSCVRHAAHSTGRRFVACVTNRKRENCIEDRLRSCGKLTAPPTGNDTALKDFVDCYLVFILRNRVFWVGNGFPTNDPTTPSNDQKIWLLNNHAVKT
jgi:hypothetical protein